MDELPDLYLEEEEEERRGAWWLVERRVEDAWWVVDLDSTCGGDLANKEEFAWPLFRFTWRDFLPGQLAKIYLAVARRPLPSLLEVVDGESPDSRRHISQNLEVNIFAQTFRKAFLTVRQSSGSTTSLPGGSQVNNILHLHILHFFQAQSEASLQFIINGLFL